MICLHDCSEILPWMQNLFLNIFLVVKCHGFFNASYIFYVYSIELMSDVDYRVQIVILKNKVDLFKKCSTSLK